MKKEFDVCDVCADPTRPVTTYTVSVEGREPGKTDRCEEHGALLEAILPAPVKRRGGRAPQPVASMDEVERAKRR